MQKLDLLKRLSLYVFISVSIIFTACNDDDNAAPAEENPEEEITDVVLIFTNQADANDVVRATATDPDGTGVQELTIQGSITLKASTTYKLTYEVKNGDEDVLAEDILQEKEEHQVFYSFTDGLFASPTGSGNVGAGNAGNPINYVDKDANGNNLGFETTWETGAAKTGKFRAVLKHQPDVKSNTSTTEDGGTDFDLEFDLTIQ